MKATVSRRQLLRYLGMGSAATVLAACTPTPTPAPTPKPPEPTKAPAGATSAPVATAVPKPTAVPATKQPLTITYWVELNSNVAATLKNLGEVACYKEMEKITGVRVEFQHPPAGQAIEQFNLMVASGKYPDIIEYNWLRAPGGPGKYLKGKVILQLNDLIDKHAPNLKKVLNDRPDWKKAVQTDDGEFYVFPFLRGDARLLTASGPAIRGNYLDRLNIPLPQTIDDWHAMLVAFKTKDPNGNGKADEIPFTMNQSGSKYRAISGCHLFIGAWGMTWDWYQVNGVVKYSLLQPEYKEFLKLLVGWYKEGLLDPEYITDNAAALDAKWTDGRLCSGYLWAGSGIGKYMGLMIPKDPSYRLVGAPLPTLKAGEKPMLGQRDQWYPGGFSAAITTAAKRPAETAQWLDFGYGPQGHMLLNHGVEGVSYTLVNGYPKYTDLIMKNPQGLPLAHAMGQHQRSNHAGPFVQDVRFFEQYLQYPEQLEAIKHWASPTNDRHLPPITATQDESKRFATIMNDVGTRALEAFDKIVTGAQPVDSWDQVVGQLKQMGVEEAVQLRQAALDRYNKR